MPTRLFSTADRPAQLGPYPLERLPRREGVDVGAIVDESRVELEGRMNRDPDRIRTAFYHEWREDYRSHRMPRQPPYGDADQVRAQGCIGSACCDQLLVLES